MNEYNTTRKLKQGARKGLQSVLLTLLLGLVAIAGTATLVWASVVSDADYYGVITVSNNDTVATDVSVNCSLNTPAMVSSGYLNASANNCAVQNTGGNDVAFMPGANATLPWCFFVPSIGADTYLSYLLYTGNVTGGHIAYFPGDGGMTADDDPSLEPSDNFTIEQAGWCDVTQIGSQFGSLSPGYVKKIGAFYVYNSASGNITAQIGADCLDFEKTNSDYVTISDQPEFTFATAGVDEPFSISAWVNLEDATSSDILGKYQTVGNLCEWLFYLDGSDYLGLKLSNPDATVYIGRKSGALTAYEGKWIYISATYNGNETSAGVNLYLDGVDCDTTNFQAGAYTGMTDTVQEVEIGAHGDHTQAFLDGKLAEVKLYDVELTPTQVLEDYQTGYDSDLVGYWKLDDGTGNPQDSSGNGFDATANTADWLTSTSVTASGVSSSNHTVTVNMVDNTGAGWLAGWDNRLRFDVDADKVDANLTHFPMLVKLSSSSGIGNDDVTAVFDELGANSLKLAVTESDGTTELEVEVEKWDNGSEEAWLWCSSNTTVIDSGTDTTFYLYFDNDHADNNAFVGVPDSAPAELVWDANFVLVDHMQDDPNNASTRDSTSNDNDGTKAGAASPAVTTNGKVGDAQDFDGTDDAIHHGQFAFTLPFNVDIIFKRGELSVPDVLISRITVVVTYQGFWLLFDAASNRFYATFGDGAVNYNGQLGPAFNDTNWHMVSCEWAASLVTMLADGVEYTAVPAGSPISFSLPANNLRVGERSDNLANDYTGFVDEVRISNATRSAAWREATYYTCWDDFVNFIPNSYGELEDYSLDFDIYIDSVLEDHTQGVSVPDNDSDWEYVTNGAMPYMEYTKITVDGVLEQHIEWEYTEGDFTDLSLNGHNATPTFRTTSSDADVSAELTMFLPVAEAQAPAWALDTTPGEMMGDNTTTSGNFSTTPSPTSAPFIAVIEAVSTATATPSQLPFTIIAGFIILTMSLGVSYLMRTNNTNSMLLKVIVIVALMGICIALKIFDFWMLVFFLIPAIAIIMLKSQGQEV